MRSPGRQVVARLAVAMLVACSASPPSAASTGDAGTPFQTATHPSLASASIPDQGGPVLAHMKLVTVTFAGYAHEGDVQAFGAWLPTSQWLLDVGHEYGVGAGTSAGSVVLQETAPAAVTLTDVGAFVAAHVRAGELPATLANDADTLYVVYYPATTSVHVVAGDAGCLAAGGFHASYSQNGLYFTYAAIPDDCAALFPKLGLDATEFVEFDASHEILEAASDPYAFATDGTSVAAGPAAWRISDPSNPSRASSCPARTRSPRRSPTARPERSP